LLTGGSPIACALIPNGRLPLTSSFLQPFLEVKHGPTNPVEFAWFSRTLPKSHLTVVSQSRYRTDRITGIMLEDFLLQHP
jgi:hypothetical protein